MVVVKFWCLLGISLSLLAGSAQAATPEESLGARLAGLDSIQASFEQRISNAQGFLVEESAGTLHLQKPNFRWDVDEPFPQIILARGEAVQIYDPDLEQVTERSIGESLDRTPLALLTSETLDLAAHFRVEDAPSADEMERYVLYPVASDALFERIELVFDEARLAALAIIDHAGQQTLIRFSEYPPQQVIQSDVFELEYPPGTDFVRG